MGRISACFAMVLCAGLAVAQMPGPTSATAPLRSHVRLGAWSEGMVADPGRFTELEDQLGRPLDIASYFYGFGDWFPTAVERRFAAGGSRDVLVSWDMGDSRFTDWSRGDHDAYLRTIAGLAQRYPYTLYVRPWPEMNGDWQTYLPTTAGDRARGGTPREFVDAWRHVVSTVRAAGGTNIKWVFNPYAATYPGTADVRALWPGREYVDVLGIDGYNWGGGPAPWQSFEDVFSEMYTTVTALDPDRPVWICEFASKEPRAEDGAPTLPAHSKGEWITNAFQSTAFPRVRALIWFHERKERDWRIDSSRDSLLAFRVQAAASAPGTQTAPGSPATAPLERSRPGVRIRRTATRVRVSIRPRQKTLVLVTKRIKGTWRGTHPRFTSAAGRTVVRIRKATRIRISVPATATTRVIATR